MTVRLIDLPPQAPKPREKLFEFLHGHDRILCELVDHGPVYGVEALFLHNEELAFSRTFSAASRPDAHTARDGDRVGAEEERKWMEKGASDTP